MKADFRVALLGQGFMGKAHSNAYSQVEHFYDCPYRVRRRLLCGRDAASLAAMADRWGWEETTTDWRSAIERSDIDAVDVSLPNYLHAEVSIAAAQAGKMVLCEKPLALSLAEANAMADAARRVPHARLVQLPACAGNRLREAADRPGTPRHGLPLRRRLPPAVGSGYVARRHVEDGSRPGRLRRRRRSAHAPARHRDVPERSGAGGDCHDPHLHARSPDRRCIPGDAELRERQRRDVRGDALRDWLQELQQLSDARVGRHAALRSRAAQPSPVPRRDNAIGRAGRARPAGHRHEAPGVSEFLAPGAHHRLRAHLHRHAGGVPRRGLARRRLSSRFRRRAGSAAGAGRAAAIGRDTAVDGDRGAPGTPAS